jgi:hypothetical protein
MVCDGGSDLYKITDDPVEPFADYLGCEECHILIEPAWNKSISMHPYEMM